LKAIGSSWQRETFVKVGKWAMVGNNQNSGVVDACAEALLNLKQWRRSSAKCDRSNLLMGRTMKVLPLFLAASPISMFELSSPQ
jgi:hypothetical protein